MKHLPLLLLLLSSSIWSQITPQQMVNNMGRGINIGNVLSAPVEGNWAAPLEETYITRYCLRWIFNMLESQWIFLVLEPEVILQCTLMLQELLEVIQEVLQII